MKQIKLTSGSTLPATVSLSNRLFLITIVCLLSLGMGCRPSTEKAKVQVEPEKQKPVVSVEPTEPRPPLSDESRVTREEGREGVELALKFTPQDLTKYKVITEAERNIKAEGSLSDDDSFKGGTTSNRLEMTFTQQIQSVDAQGNAVAKITINEMKYLAKVKDNVTTDFDSSKDANDPLSKLIGQSYTIEITPSGQVSKIIDVQEAKTTVKGNPSAGKVASMLLQPDAIKLRHTIPALPDTDKNKLSPGDTWGGIRNFSFGMMGSKAYERIYTLKEVKDADNRRIAEVEMNAIPSIATTQEQQEEQAMGIFTKMFDNTETYTGRLRLDLTTSKVEKYTEKLQSEWLAVDPSAMKQEDGEPAALRMTATRFYEIEKVEK